jgi:hypothetical protein
MSTASQLRDVRTALEEVRKCLMTPTPAKVEECSAYLQEALVSMVAVEKKLQEQPEVASDNVVPGVRVELVYVRRELKRVSALLEHAAAFHTSWAGLLGMIGSGYTATGQPVTLSAAGRIALEG